MQTPYQKMAALPLNAALAAPLVDSSPFRLDDLDTICLADEAKRVAASLAPALGALGCAGAWWTQGVPARKTGAPLLLCGRRCALGGGRVQEG